MIDLDEVRLFLIDALPAGEPVEIEDPDILDAAAAVIVNGKGANRENP